MMALSSRVTISTNHNLYLRCNSNENLLKRIMNFLRNNKGSYKIKTESFTSPL